MVDQLQTNAGVCVTKDGVVPSGTDADCCCEGDPGADCGTCNSGTQPEYVTIISSGWSDSALNGTFILDRAMPDRFSACTYVYYFPSGITFGSKTIEYLSALLQKSFQNMQWGENPPYVGGALAVRYQNGFVTTLANCDEHSGLSIAMSDNFTGASVPSSQIFQSTP